MQANRNIPLVVDLDGTLIKNELPWETFCFALTHRPFKVIKLFLKKLVHFKGGLFKAGLAEIDDLTCHHLVFSDKVVAYLKEEKAKNRKIILCTGSNQKYANKIKSLCPLIDEAYGSKEGYNLSGKKKAAFLEKKYGLEQFDYIGNSKVDFYVAKKARHFLFVESFWPSVPKNKVKIYKLFKDESKNIPALSYFKALGYQFWIFHFLIFLIFLFGVFILKENDFFYPNISLTDFSFYGFSAVLSLCLINSAMSVFSSMNLPFTKPINAKKEDLFAHLSPFEVSPSKKTLLENTSLRLEKKTSDISRIGGKIKDIFLPPNMFFPQIFSYYDGIVYINLYLLFTVLIIHVNLPFILKEVNPLFLNHAPLVFVYIIYFFFLLFFIIGFYIISFLFYLLHSKITKYAFFLHNYLYIKQNQKILSQSQWNETYLKFKTGALLYFSCNLAIASTILFFIICYLREGL